MGAAVAMTPPASAPSAPPTSTPPGAGAPPPSTSPPPSPSESPPGAPAGDAPPAGAAPPDQPALDLPTTPPPVPYGKFRAERAKLNGRIGELERKLAANAQLEQRVAEMQRRIESQQQNAQHFEALSRVIRTNPALAGQIEALIGELPADPGERAAIVAQLPPEVVKGLEAMNGLAQRAQQQEQRAARMAEQRELEETERSIRATFKDILEKRKLPVDAFTPLLEAYTLRRIAQLGDEADFEDVPYIAAEFLKPILEWHNNALAALGSGRREDAGLPVMPSGSPPIHAAAPLHANDATTNKLAETFLRSRGWAA